MRGGARGPHARRTRCTLNVRPRAPTKQMGLFQQPGVYDEIGRGYATRRRPDPRITQAIRAALGDARTVLNVGAGSGSYEPAPLAVVAAEPSLEMIRQRPAGAAPAVRAVAEALPFAAESF